MLLKYYQKLDDTISYLLASTANEGKLLKKIFKKKPIILVDIGSNEGSYIDLVDNNLSLKKIYCFEPIRELTEKIKKKYSLQKIHISNLALSNKAKKTTFYQYAITSTSSLYKQNNTYKSLKNLKKTFKVETDKFDKIFNKKQKIDICKIDVQGEDYNVLLGMKKNLKNKNIKLLKVELSFINFYEKTGENFYKIIHFLEKFRYRMISISKIKFKDDKLIFIDAYFQLK
jgi:FkbM family methyltransferase